MATTAYANVRISGTTQLFRSGAIFSAGEGAKIAHSFAQKTTDQVAVFKTTAAKTIAVDGSNILTVGGVATTDPMEGAGQVFAKIRGIIVEVVRDAEGTAPTGSFTAGINCSGVGITSTSFTWTDKGIFVWLDDTGITSTTANYVTLTVSSPVGMTCNIIIIGSSS